MDPVVARLVPVLAHGAMASWLSEWLREATSPEDVEVHTRPWGIAPHVRGHGRSEHLFEALGRWRRDHISAHLRIITAGMTAEPVDPMFDRFALAAGCRIDLIAVDPMRRTVLVSAPASGLLESEINPVRPLAIPDGSALRRILDDAINDATRALTELEVARPRQDLAAALLQAESLVNTLTLPVSHSPRKIELLSRAVRVLTMIDVASRDEGGALTGHASNSRNDTLLNVAHAARLALEAAFDPR
jgi:hypothetical protein